MKSNDQTALALAVSLSLCVAALVNSVGRVSAQGLPEPFLAPPAASAKPTVAKPSTPRPPRAVAAQGPIAPANGCGTAGALGVSRVQEIDTNAGPRLGHQQYKDIDFLGDHEVVLTFDDGPLRPYTMPVLKALDAHCTKATFFVVGRMALSDPALVRDTAKRGHTIGTHTWSHVDVRKTGPSRGKGEIELGLSAVSKALGHPVSPFFRFPFLSAPQGMADYARSRKLGVFSIEVDANDYRTKNPAEVHKTVLSQLEDTRKGIILFHDIQASTAGALKGLLDELKARGFKVVHMVPKGGVGATTLPEYDAIATQEMNRKSVASADDPLANRSIVWPVTAGRDPEPHNPEGCVCTACHVSARTPALGHDRRSARTDRSIAPAALANTAASRRFRLG
jgi:peptidoglycan-N-acetylglucosamine deacetylase